MRIKKKKKDGAHNIIFASLQAVNDSTLHKRNTLAGWDTQTKSHMRIKYTSLCQHTD